jgi:hypothetical protein
MRMGHPSERRGGAIRTARPERAPRSSVSVLFLALQHLAGRGVKGELDRAAFPVLRLDLVFAALALDFADLLAEARKDVSRD